MPRFCCAAYLRSTIAVCSATHFRQLASVNSQVGRTIEVDVVDFGEAAGVPAIPATCFADASPGLCRLGVDDGLAGDDRLDEGWCWSGRSCDRLGDSRSLDGGPVRLNS